MYLLKSHRFTSKKMKIELSCLKETESTAASSNNFKGRTRDRSSHSQFEKRKEKKRGREKCRLWGDGTKEWRKAQASTCRNYYPLFLFFQIDAKEGSTDPSRTCSGPTRFISSLLTLLFADKPPHCKLVFSFVRAALVHAISQDREAYDK